MARQSGLPRLGPVQVLRAVAALAVAVAHIEAELRARGGEGYRGLPWDAGVDIFFVISGFVTVYASDRLFGRQGAGAVFLARRVARIVPLYWLATALLLAVLWLRPNLLNSAVADPALIVASFVFWPMARSDGPVQPVYSLGWALNYGMFFYILFAVALALPRRRAVQALSLGIGALVLFGQVAGPLPQPLGFWSDPVLLEFATGMWLGLVRAEGLTIPFFWRVIAAVAALKLFAGIGADPAQWGVNRAVLFTLPAALLVAACGLGPGHSEADREPWAMRVGVALGEASYAIYLIHPFAIRALAQIIDASGAWALLGPLGFAALSLLASCGAALVVHRSVERPLTARLRRTLERRAPAARVVE